MAGAQSQFLGRDHRMRQLIGDEGRGEKCFGGDRFLIDNRWGLIVLAMAAMALVSGVAGFLTTILFTRTSRLWLLSLPVLGDDGDAKAVGQGGNAAAHRVFPLWQNLPREL